VLLSDKRGHAVNAVGEVVHLMELMGKKFPGFSKIHMTRPVILKLLLICFSIGFTVAQVTLAQLTFTQISIQARTMLHPQLMRVHTLVMANG
jgi:hypothetical protein